MFLPCECMSVCIIKNRVLETSSVAGTTTEAVLNTCQVLLVCLSVGWFCQHDSIITMKYTVTKLHSCVVEIIMKAMFRYGHGQSMGAKIKCVVMLLTL